MGLNLRFLGHATFSMAADNGTRLIVDPYISGNAACPVTTAEVGELDMVVVTHGAKDHLGDAVALMSQGSPVLLCGRDVRAYSERKGIPRSRILGMVMGAEREVKGVKVRAVEARHGSYVVDGDAYFSDVALGYIVSHEGARVWHVGDTAIFSDMKLIAQLYQPQVILMPIGSLSGVIEISAAEAALVCEWIQPKVVVPIHYRPVEEKADLELFVAEVARRCPATRVVVMQPGQTLRVDPT